MPRFSKVSLDHLATCDHRLQKICFEAITTRDFKVIYGHRTQVQQDAAYRRGKSKVKWPYSKHNKMPSLAVDVAPYPIDWEDIDRFVDLSRTILRIADVMKIPILWGGTWGWDWGHYELRG